jgi:hypothetical protein
MKISGCFHAVKTNRTAFPIVIRTREAKRKVKGIFLAAYPHTSRLVLKSADIFLSSNNGHDLDNKSISK